MNPQEDCFHLGVKALIYNPVGKLLLLKRSKGWDLPGGRIQKNESPEEALKREVHEETGLQNISGISPLAMALSNIRIGEVGLIFALYTCDIADTSHIQLSSEHTHFAWFDPTEAATLLTNYPPELTQKLATICI